MLKRILICLLCLMSLISGAQNCKVKCLDIRNGLSSNYVLASALDKQGTVWFATEEGLNRFDGLDFYTYYKSSKGIKGITGNELKCLQDDPEEPIIWIGTQRNGVNAYNYETNSFTYYLNNPKDKNSLISKGVTDIKPSVDGSIWVSTYNKGVDYLNKKTGHFVHYNRSNVKGLCSDDVWTVLDLGNNMLLVGHVNQGLSIINTKRRIAVNYRHNVVQPNSISGDEVLCIYKDKSGRVWIGTDKGLDLFDVTRNEFVHYTDGGRLCRKIFDIKDFSDDKLWLGTEMGGIAVISMNSLFSDKKSYSVDYITEGFSENSLSGKTVRCMVQDNFHNIWIGLYGEGVNFLTYNLPYFSQMSYSPMNIPSTLTNKSVLGVCCDNSDNVWVGTDGSGINLINSDFQRVENYHKFDGMAIQSTFCDSKNNVWIGCYMGGAYVKRNGSEQFVQIFADAADTDVRTFYEDHNHSIWISTSRGVYKVDINTLKVKLYFMPKESHLTRSVCCDKMGRVWIGTFDYGFGVYSDKLKHLKSFNSAKGLPSNTVNQIICDSKGRMWVATAEGLMCFESAKSWEFKLYDCGSGLDNINIFQEQ